MNVLPTIILFHPRERRSKCTVRPLAGRTDLEFRKFPRFGTIPAGYVRLGLTGPVLSPADAAAGLLLLDGTWRLAARMEPFVRELPTRTLPPLMTAYPRISKVQDDPTGGLATVEALYAAHRLLNRSTAGLLDHYHWAAEFVAQNQAYWPGAES